jgi:hypothetical protein
MRNSVQVHLAPAKAKFGIAVAIRVAQFSANVFVHVFGEDRAHGESRPESGIRRRTRRILDRSIVIDTIAARDSDSPTLCEAIWAKGKKEHAS